MTVIWRAISITTLICLALGISRVALAISGQPGTLDPTWGDPAGSGKVFTVVSGGPNKPSAIVIQPDGKVVIAGYCGASTGGFCALRYNAAGILDLSFNSVGTVVTQITSNNDRAKAVALQPDGKILLAGQCDSGITFCALRYNRNGALDATFGNNGTVTTDVGAAAGISFAAMAVQPDGKLLLAGTCVNSVDPTNTFCAVRYKSDGSLDTTFNGTGKLVTTSSISVNAMAIQPDGKLVIVGSCSFAFCATRYNSNGSLDTSFNGTGKVTSVLAGTNDYATAVLLQPDNKIVLAGYCLTGGTAGFCALRYNSNGSVDATFAAGTIVFGSNNHLANSMALQPDGKILIAGECDSSTSADFCALRYNANGSLDTTFGNGGTITTAVSSGSSRFDFAVALALQPDGKIIQAGSCMGNSRFCAIRYDGGPFGYQNCKPDIDGDGSFLATTDALINMRIALGITGNAVIGGITFSSTATRNTWPLIRDYLVTQCGMSLVQ